RRWQWRMKKLG
nr:Chain A, Lactotransferrin [synthetic construct]